MKQLTINPAESSSAWAIQSIIIASADFVISRIHIDRLASDQFLRNPWRGFELPRLTNVAGEENGNAAAGFPGMRHEEVGER